MRSVVLVAALVSLTGCGSNLYKVNTSPDEGGVPFFPLQSVDTTKTVYEQAWLELEVTAFAKEPGDTATKAPAPAEAGQVDINSATEAELEAVLGLKGLGKKIIASRPYTKLDDLVAKNVVSNANLTAAKPKLVVITSTPPSVAIANTSKVPTVRIIGYTTDENVGMDIYHAYITHLAATGTSDATKAWSNSGLAIISAITNKKMATTEPAPVAFDKLSTLPIAAVERTRSQVPTSSPLFFNVHVPHGGTANGSIELATNGTLTKAAAEKQDQLPGTIVTTIGNVLAAAVGSGAMTGFVSSYFPPSAAAAGVGAFTPERIEFRITRVRRHYTYALTHPSDVQPATCGTPEVVMSNTPKSLDCRAALTIEVKRADGTSTNAKKDEDDNKIEFAGSIKLPEEKKK